MTLQTPHNFEAEQAVLGGLLYDPHAAWAGVEDVLSADDVYAPLHGDLFDAVAGAIAAGLTPDCAVLARRFSGSRAFCEDREDLRRVGTCAREAAFTPPPGTPAHGGERPSWRAGRRRGRGP